MPDSKPGQMLRARRVRSGSRASPLGGLGMMRLLHRVSACSERSSATSAARKTSTGKMHPGLVGGLSSGMFSSSSSMPRMATTSFSSSFVQKMRSAYSRRYVSRSEPLGGGPQTESQTSGTVTVLFLPWPWELGNTMNTSHSESKSSSSRWSNSRMTLTARSIARFLDCALFFLSLLRSRGGKSAASIKR